MIPLNQIKVASPCPADWDEMAGTEQVRFCQGCRKNVYNLSEMTCDEAQALVSRLEGRLCIRFYTRADGTMLTQDCPVGLRAVRVKLAKKFSYAATLLLACGTGLLRGTSRAVQGMPLAPRSTHVVKCSGKHPLKPSIQLHTAPPVSHPTMGKAAVPQSLPLMGSMAAPLLPPTPPTMGTPMPIPTKAGK